MDGYRRVCLAWGLTVAVGLVTVVSSTGCSMISAAAYVIYGDQLKADFDGLQEKRVAIVCRPPATAQFKNATASREIAKRVSLLLRTNVKKITVIDQREVAKWIDENDWEEFTEIGKAVDADMVVGIDLEHFSLQEEQTLLQGKASCVLTVYDMRQEGIEVFERPMPQVLFPPNGPIAASEKPEAEFRRQFIDVVSQKIAWHFYDHEAYLDFASDSSVLK